MRYALAILIGVGGLIGIVAGIAWIAAVLGARKVFERILASSAIDIVKLTAAELIERVKNPLLRRIVNQRTGAMAGGMLVDFVREDLSARLRMGFGVIGGGVAAIILAFSVPFF